MKDFIVMIAILILGLVIAGLVIAFKGKMDTLSEGANTDLEAVTTTITGVIA